jgi:hypothetical protein
MPVADLKAVLTAPDAPSRSALIAGHLGRLECELARTRAAVDSLRSLLQPPDTAPAIEYRSVPATSAAIRQVVDREDVLPWWEGAGSYSTTHEISVRRAPARVLPPRRHRHTRPSPLDNRDRLARLPC